MNILNSLKPAKGAVRSNKRLGRGQGSGKGGTSGKGHKGDQSRSGYKRNIGYEGGQMPLHRRVPKFGFTKQNHISYKAINLDVLEKIANEHPGKKIDFSVLIGLGLVSKKDLIKILGRGELKSVIEVSAHAFSKTSREAIEKAGGKANIIK